MTDTLLDLICAVLKLLAAGALCPVGRWLVAAFLLFFAYLLVAQSISPTPSYRTSLRPNSASEPSEKNARAMNRLGYIRSVPCRLVSL